jgi:ribonuclease P protein component
MLARPADFAALQARGKVRSDPLLVVRTRRTDLETSRFGLATGRNLGSAVVRNRIRRRLREILRALARDIGPGWDILVIARPEIVKADSAAIAGAIRRLLERGGVVRGTSA